MKDGDDVVGVKRAISRAGFMDWNEGEFDDAYNEKIADAVQAFQKKNGLDATGAYGENTHAKLKGKKVPSGSPNAGKSVWDDKAAAMYKQYHPPDSVPDLGPLMKGGKSVLKQDLTHATSGLPTTSSGKSLWPAYDDCFDEGITILAPEDIEVTKASSSNPGDACYAKSTTGSKLQYWFGHLKSAPAVGTKIKKGAKVGVTCENHQGGGPHVHAAVNVEKLWGTGKMMTHKTSYSHGAPLIGDQLAAGHPL